MGTPLLSILGPHPVLHISAPAPVEQRPDGPAVVAPATRPVVVPATGP
ncbi:hypothetical protein ABZ654_32115 [Streptomyces hygroscopicus]